MHHLKVVEIPAGVLARWRDQAEWLATIEPLVLMEIRDLDHDCTRHRLRRCAKAARWLATIADEPYRGGARALAVELEAMSQ